MSKLAAANLGDLENKLLTDPKMLQALKDTALANGRALVNIRPDEAGGFLPTRKRTPEEKALDFALLYGAGPGFVSAARGNPGAVGNPGHDFSKPLRLKPELDGETVVIFGRQLYWSAPPTTVTVNVSQVYTSTVQQTAAVVNIPRDDDFIGEMFSRKVSELKAQILGASRRK